GYRRYHARFLRECDGRSTGRQRSGCTSPARCADYGLRCARESERASCRLCVPSLLQAQVQVTAQTYGSRTPCRVNPLRQLGEGKNKQVSLPCRSSKCYSL